MAKWRKRFEAWATARQPIPVAEVEAVLLKVFGDRVREATGSSHRWMIEVNELQGMAGPFVTGLIAIPVSGGQVVKAPYCRMCYEAATILDLVNDEDDE